MKAFVSHAAKKPAAKSVQKAKEVIKQAATAEKQDKLGKLKDKHATQSERKSEHESKLKKVTVEHTVWMRDKDKEAKSLQEKLNVLRSSQKERASKFAAKAGLIDARIKDLANKLADTEKQMAAVKQS